MISWSVAVEQDVAHLARQLLPRGIHAEAQLLGQAFDHPQLHRGGRLPGADGAVFDRQLGVDHHLGSVDPHQGAEPRAVRAGAVRAVEGEEPGRDLGQAEAADRAGVVLRQHLFGLAFDRQYHQAAGHPQGGLERAGDPLLEPFLDHQAVDDQVDVVFLLLVERRQLAGKVVGLAVDPRPHEAFARHLLELLLVFALLAAHVGRQDLQLGLGRQSQHPVDHLLHRLRADRGAVVRAMGHADRGVEQAQVVVDLGDRADGRARVARDRFLLDRDRRREAVDRVDVGLLHLLEELPGIGRKRFHVAPLALGEEGVESERRLARAGNAGDHHQAVARDLEGRILQIVFARTAQDDLVHGGGTLTESVRQGGNGGPDLTPLPPLPRTGEGENPRIPPVRWWRPKTVATTGYPPGTPPGAEGARHRRPPHGSRSRPRRDPRR